MPSGKVHDRMTVGAAVLAVPAWWLFTPAPADPTTCAALVVATLFSGLMLSPDLDLDSSIYHRWGPIRFLWWPYQKLIPHRSRFSHSFVLAPLLRVLYFLGLLWLLLRGGVWVASQFVPLDRNAISRQATDLFITFWKTHPKHFQMTALGIFIGSALHCGADIIWTSLKHLRRQAMRL